MALTRKEKWLTFKWASDRWFSRNGEFIMGVCWIVFVIVAVWFIGDGILW